MLKQIFCDHQYTYGANSDIVCVHGCGKRIKYSDKRWIEYWRKYFKEHVSIHTQNRVEREKGGLLIDAHRKIMNIQVDKKKMNQAVEKSSCVETHIGQMEMLYKLAYRDARHEAAELVASVETVNREVYASYD